MGRIDYLDLELANYQERIDATCDTCGEINDEDYKCGCGQDEEE